MFPAVPGTELQEAIGPVLLLKSEIVVAFCFHPISLNLGMCPFLRPWLNRSGLLPLPSVRRAGDNTLSGPECQLSG